MIKSLKQNEHGIVSIFVAVMFVLITSLITTSFAFLMRREQQQILDQQLSTQAFYAAESGVNDAIKALATDGQADIDQCGAEIGSTSKQLATGFQQYTCILIETTPGEVESTNVDETPSIFTLETEDDIDNITISWQRTDYDPTASVGRLFAVNSNHHLPTDTFNNSNKGTTFNPNDCDPTASLGSYGNNTGVLKATLIPIKSGNFNRTYINDNSFTVFLYPKCSSGDPTTTGPGTISYTSGPGSNNQGAFADGQCHTQNVSLGGLPRHCNVQINGLGSGGPNTKRYYVVLTSFYQDSDVTITPDTGGGAGHSSIIDSQAVIDVTGQAQDVLRRIQVRVPLTDTNSLAPPAALESADSICKRLNIFPSRPPSEQVQVNSSIPACQISN